MAMLESPCFSHTQPEKTILIKALETKTEQLRQQNERLEKLNQLFKRSPNFPKISS